ncbi:MAG: hypothetical protein ACPGJI_04720 [Kangiellaceae bacterium]
MKQQKFHLFVLTVTIFMISSCGFHLRGSLDNLSSTSLVGQKVYINTLEDEQEIETDIRRVLSLSNVDLVKEPVDSKYQIFILNSSLDRYASGLDTNGRTNEYEFIMKISFVMAESSSILKEIQANKNPNNSVNNRATNNNKVIEQEKHLRISRHYYFDTNDLVGKKAEEKSLLNEMKNNLSLQLLQQFSAFHNLSKNLDKT